MSDLPPSPTAEAASNQPTSLPDKAAAPLAVDDPCIATSPRSNFHTQQLAPPVLTQLSRSLKRAFLRLAVVLVVWHCLVAGLAPLIAR